MLKIRQKQARVFSIATTLILAILLSACSPEPETVLTQLPEKNQQALLVISDNWETSAGQLQRYEKTETAGWQAVGESIQVMLGRNGMAWGRGLHDTGKLKDFKKEGDGKAPAGVFSLGNSFGYNNFALEGQRYPYRSAGIRDYYVDDSTSPDYNQWVMLAEDQANTPETHWKSFERMRRDDGAYEWGVEVEHNKSPVTPMAGSAIFMHIWKSPDTATAGCTAMPKADIQAILTWLDERKHPVLIQAPKNAFGKLSLKKENPDQ